jgi:hypothetical protein
MKGRICLDHVSRWDDKNLTWCMAAPLNHELGVCASAWFVSGDFCECNRIVRTALFLVVQINRIKESC